MDAGAGELVARDAHVSEAVCELLVVGDPLTRSQLGAPARSTGAPGDQDRAARKRGAG